MNKIKEIIKNSQRNVHYNLYRCEAGKKSLISEFSTYDEAVNKLNTIKNFNERRINQDKSCQDFSIEADFETNDSNDNHMNNYNEFDMEKEFRKRKNLENQRKFNYDDIME
jgi:hypothetical protein